MGRTWVGAATLCAGLIGAVAALAEPPAEARQRAIDRARSACLDEAGGRGRVDFDSVPSVYWHAATQRFFIAFEDHDGSFELECEVIVDRDLGLQRVYLQEKPGSVHL